MHIMSESNHTMCGSRNREETDNAPRPDLRGSTDNDRLRRVRGNGPGMHANNVTLNRVSVEILAGVYC